MPSSSFLPKTPSPKNITYLSSSISCKKKTFDSELMSNRLSWEEYLVPFVTPEFSLLYSYGSKQGIAAAMAVALGWF